MIKEIMVVSPDQYKDMARRLSHEISKVPGCNGANWNVKQYEDNEFQLGGNRYAIFIGNSEENTLTRDFLQVIKKTTNQAGACFGYDGTKAVVFGEGKLEQLEDFKDVFKKSNAILAEKAPVNVGAGIAGAAIAFGSLPLFFISVPLAIIVNYISSRHKREKELRTEQTKAALTIFLTEHFDKWIGLESKVSL